jgi:hypothetical protein
MNGAAYVAVKRLTTLEGAVLADEGQTCEQVPAKSLPWLRDQGLIRKLKPGELASDVKAAEGQE